MARSLRTKEPPSPVNHFLVRRDARGCWTVEDERGLVGGIFISRAVALRFARRESNGVAGAVICSPEELTVQRGVVLPFGRESACRSDDEV